MSDGSKEDRPKIEEDIAKYLLNMGYPASNVRSMMARHRYKGIRAVHLLAKDLNRPDAIILNLGCGSGMNHFQLVKGFHPSKVYGLDTDKRAVELCRRYNPSASNYINEYDGSNIPFQDNFFDAIICDTVIEHVLDPGLFLKEMHRVLKPNGLVYITTANKLWPLEPHYNLLFLSWLPKKWADYYMRLLRLKNKYYDINLFTYKKFINQLKQSGFKVYDATFDIMARPELYDADKERPVLKYLKPIGKIINAFPYFLKYQIQYFNFGWIIIGKKTS